MFRKIFDWYMKQKVGHVLLSLYLMAATSATIIVPDNSGLIIWAWGAGATLVVGPWMWSLNKATKQNTGKNLWNNG
jgi:hypothetical protein